MGYTVKVIAEGNKFKIVMLDEVQKKAPEPDVERIIEKLNPNERRA